MINIFKNYPIINNLFVTDVYIGPYLMAHSVPTKNNKGMISCLKNEMTYRFVGYTLKNDSLSRE